MNILRLVLFFFVVITITPQSYGQSPVIEKSTVIQNIGNKRYYVHRVKQGETLFSISRVYKISIEELQKINPELQDGLKIEQNLLIPVIDEDSAELDSPQPTSRPNPVEIPQTRIEPKREKSKELHVLGDVVFYVHTVSEGQTLFFISQLYEISTTEMYAANLGISETLSIGQKLLIPCPSCPLPSQEKVSVRQERKRDNTHTVDSTETVYSISLQYSVPPEALYVYNPRLKDSVYAGMVLEIPQNKEFIRLQYIYYELPRNAVLAQISQRFRVTDDEIIALNPRVSKELVPESIIRIPLNAANKNLAYEALPTYQGFLFHVVQAQETVFSITRKYGITERDLQRVNKNLNKEQLSIGTVLRIPVSETKEWYIFEESIVRKLPEKKSSFVGLGSCFDSLRNTKQAFEIVVMLPFYLQTNMMEDERVEIINKRKELFEPSIPFIEYYQGLLLGIDSLRKKGISITMHVFDITNDSLELAEVLKKISNVSIDIIIGPVFPETYAIAAEFAKKRQIPIVLPLISTDGIVDDNPYTLQVNSPERIRYRRLAEKITAIPKANIIVVYNSVVHEQSQVDECKYVFTYNYADSITKNQITYTEILFPEHGMKGIEAALRSDVPNVVIVISRNQAFITNLVTQLFRHVRRNPIQMYALSSWERFENIELDFLFSLNLHYTSNGFVDYEHEEVTLFIKEYRELFKTEPSRFSFQGFDQILYFMESLEFFGDSFFDCIPAYSKIGLFNSFSFIKEKPNSGLLNSAVEVIEYTKQNTLIRSE